MPSTGEDLNYNDKLDSQFFKFLIVGYIQQ